MTLSDAAHYVYELYGADGECLYIGCTTRLGPRLAVHTDKPWWTEVASVKVLTHDGQEAGRRAEEARIRSENPRHNRMFTDHPTPAVAGWATRRAREEARHSQGELCPPWQACKPCRDTRVGTDQDMYSLTTDDVAERYHLTEWGVRRLVRARKLNAINIGTERRRILRFSEDDLRKFETSRSSAA